eukprot:TRINITY_DN16152_c0_g1_i1.p1 TRINITY_DN16152_c0_g1~~TRINITY_DN16152_c0_g1_i1.p1  ORF type:complete len:555 (-),score=89.59 TRINITY_DN16152_c0_g1_i1:44-1708(-)
MTRHAASRRFCLATQVEAVMVNASLNRISSCEAVDVPLRVIARIEASGRAQQGVMGFHLWGGRDRSETAVLEVTTVPFYMDLRHPSLIFALDEPCKSLVDLITRMSLSPSEPFALSFRPAACECTCCCCAQCLCACCRIKCPGGSGSGDGHCTICCIAPPPCLRAESTNPALPFSFEAEFRRQGLLLREGSAWRLSCVNSDYTLCPSYPPAFVVPAAVSDAELPAVAAFREKARIPVLCWWSRDGGAILRGSQPRVGCFSARCAEDEELVRAARVLAPSNSLHILDCRPYLNSVVNEVKGGGFESESCYKGCTVDFLQLPNIHEVRTSFQSLYDALSASNTPLPMMSRVAESRWLDYVQLLLCGALRVVRLVCSPLRCSVLVHCSDGWDRTAQLCALAELCLDPYYRTARGFCVLVEKEWLQMGHKFEDRLRRGDEASPVFLQFLDCAAQLARQYPAAFQFTDAFLASIAEESMVGRFGTFACNSRREREVQPRGCGCSLWAHLHHVARARTALVNCLYDPAGPRVIVPMPEPHHVTLWNTFHLRLLNGHPNNV